MTLWVDSHPSLTLYLLQVIRFLPLNCYWLEQTAHPLDRSLVQLALIVAIIDYLSRRSIEGLLIEILQVLMTRELRL